MKEGGDQVFKSRKVEGEISLSQAAEECMRVLEANKNAVKGPEGMLDTPDPDSNSRTEAFFDALSRLQVLANHIFEKGTVPREVWVQLLNEKRVTKDTLEGIIVNLKPVAEKRSFTVSGEGGLGDTLHHARILQYFIEKYFEHSEK